MSSNIEQSITFNNNAVEILAAGYLQEAKDLFRAALDAKLAHDRTQEHRCNHDGDSNQEQGVVQATPNRCVTPECVFVAEYHVYNKSTYTSFPKIAPGSVTTLSKGGFTTSASPYGNSLANDGTTPSLLLFAQAFVVERAQLEYTQYTSAVPVFNLGLVHQLEDPSSTKARSFYEVAASLLAMDSWDAHSALLRVAVTNNFAVWTFQNGQLLPCRAAFVELERMVAAWPGDPEQATGFQSNLTLHFLRDTQQDYSEDTDCSDDDDDLSRL